MSHVSATRSWSFPRQAFSLVELSIVLVILGLLVGGVLSGQSLIRAAQLRAVTTEYQRYLTAVNTFRDKYFAIPGDMPNATSVWGKDNTRCTGHTGTTATPGTCNGDGDGTVTLDAIENYRFWQQLALAGLIEGNYNGYISPVAFTTPPVPGTEVPTSKLGKAYWVPGYMSQSSAFHYEIGYSDLPDVRENTFLLNGRDTGFWSCRGGNAACTPILKPEEAWNIDTKMDDGRPAFGIVRSIAGSCTTANDSTAAYNISNSSTVCAILGFRFR